MPLVPIVAIAAMLFLALYLFTHYPLGWVAVAAWLLIGAGVYRRSRKGRSPSRRDTTLGMLSTRLRTPKNEYVTVPNGVLVGGTVTNFSAPRAHDHPLTIYSSVTIGYDAPWRKVHEIMIAAAKGTEGVLEEPAPFVLQRALGDWYVEYQVNAAIDAARAAELPAIYSRLHANLQDSFNTAGVEIMSPSYFAVRDGNLTTIPADHRPKEAPPAFRVSVNPRD